MPDKTVVMLFLTDYFHLCLSIGCLLVLAKGITFFCNRMALPTVLGEILSGILIGPTLLGEAFPSVSEWVFPKTGEVGRALHDIIQIAVILLLFVAGMEIRLKALWGESRTIFSVVAGSMLVPLLTGFGLVYFCPLLFDVLPEAQSGLACFMGVAFAISALPVIIRILMDLGLYHSNIAVITVASAGIMDILGWCGFALVLHFFNPVPGSGFLTMLSSHATILSFIAGVLIGNAPYIPMKGRKVIYSFIVLILSPLFFISIGASVNFAQNLNLPLIAVVILVASLSKVTGTFLGGLLGGLKRKEALTVGLALNARGAMEILLSKQALDLGLIQPVVFVALVIMALFTSLVGGPAIRFLLSKGTDYRASEITPEVE